MKKLLILALCLVAFPALADVQGTASVIDDDTLEIHGQRIRLHGVDAPESSQACKDEEGKRWLCVVSRRQMPLLPKFDGVLLPVNQ